MSRFVLSATEEDSADEEMPDDLWEKPAKRKKQAKAKAKKKDKPEKPPKPVFELFDGNDSEEEDDLPIRDGVAQNECFGCSHSIISGRAQSTASLQKLLNIFVGCRQSGKLDVACAKTAAFFKDKVQWSVNKVIYDRYHAANPTKTREELRKMVLQHPESLQDWTADQIMVHFTEHDPTTPIWIQTIVEDLAKERRKLKRISYLRDPMNPNHIFVSNNYKQFLHTVLVEAKIRSLLPQKMHGGKIRPMRIMDPSGNDDEEEETNTFL